jgi:hypothetical protein
MACTVVGTLCKRSDENRLRGIDLSPFCSRRWEPGGILGSGVAVRPAALDDGGARGPMGWEFVTQNAGQSGSKEPKWIGPAGSTVVDGSLNWIAQAISNASLERVIPGSGSVVWSAPAGYTVTPGPFQNTAGKQQIECFIAGGSDGDEDQMVIAKVTFDDGSIEDFAISVSVHDDGTD